MTGLTAPENPENPANSGLRGSGGAVTPYFFQTLHQCLRHDFGHGQLAEYFHETRSLVELDTSYTIKLKSQRELKFQDEVRVRTRLGQLAPEMVQGQKRFVVMLAINDGPEPWEWDEWVKKRTEQKATAQQPQTDGTPLTKAN